MNKIGKYTLLEKLGSGGFGDVYKAEDPLHLLVAIKVLRADFSNEPAAVARFHKEAEMGRLFHAHIATITDYGQTEEDSRLYLVMRYVDGSSLKEKISSGEKLSWDESLRILGEAGDGLDYAHKHGLIHRDIKPANILLSPMDGAVVTDFGLARAVISSGLTTTSVVVGTPSYIPLEIWDDRPAVPASDLYSLACVFYEMVTGKVLFQGDSALSTMKQHFDGPHFGLDWDACAKAGSKDVMLKALAKDPADRYASAADFVKALKEASPSLKPTNVSVQPPPPALFPVPPLPASSRIAPSTSNPTPRPAAAVIPPARQVNTTPFPLPPQAPSPAPSPKPAAVPASAPAARAIPPISVPDPPPAVPEIQRKTDAAVASQDWGKAVKFARQWIKEAPFDPLPRQSLTFAQARLDDFYRNQIKAAYRNDNRPEAENLAGEWVQFSPESSEAALALGKAKIQKGFSKSTNNAIILIVVGVLWLIPLLWPFAIYATIHYARKYLPSPWASCVTWAAIAIGLVSLFFLMLFIVQLIH